MALDAWHAAQGLSSSRVDRQGNALIARAGVWVEGNARLDRLFALCAAAGSSALALEADVRRFAAQSSLSAQAAAAALHVHVAAAHAPLRALRGAGRSPLSLRRVALLSQRLSIRLRDLAATLKLCAALRGVDLCNALHTALHATADPETRALYSDLLQAASAPLLRQMSAALLDGSHADPHGEALVQLRSDASSWLDLCRPTSTTPPPWLPAGVLIRLVGAVRALLFLRHWSRDLLWLQELRAGPLAAPLAPDAAALRFPCPGLAASLQAYATELEGRAAEQLLAADAETRLVQCHECLALASGSFAAALLTAHASLGSRAARPRLLAALDEATRSAALPLSLASRLDVLLLPPEQGSFALAFNADPPLSLLLSPAAVAAYAPLFRLMWGARHAEAQLSVLWKTLGRSEARRPIALAAHAQLVAVRALLSLLHAHLAPALAALVRALRPAEPSVDALLAAHTAYLAAIQPTAMLPPAAHEPLHALVAASSAWCAAHAHTLQALQERMQAQQRTAPQKGRRPVLNVLAEDDDETDEAVARQATAAHAVSQAAQTLRSTLITHVGPLSTFADLLQPLVHAH